MRRHLAAIAALLLAAALVTWIRLLPLALPLLPDLATAGVRQQLFKTLPPAAPGDSAADRVRALDAWIAAHRDEYARRLADETARLDDLLHYRDARGRRWVYLGDLDSYTWLRAARNELSHGAPCDSIAADGLCRDDFTLAPVGLANPKAHSLHVAAIAAVQRVATWFDPDFPLPASAYLVPVLAGLLGVIAAFAVGRRLGGVLGGFFAAVVSGVHPMLLQRSFGSDNDVWNVVLPLCIAWALIAAMQATGSRLRIGGAVLAGAIAGVHAATWNGWSFGFVVLLTGLVAAAALHAAHWAMRHHEWRPWAAPRARQIALVALVFLVAASAASQLVGAEETPAGALGRLLAAPAPSPAGAPALVPSALGMVSELAVPNLGGIAAQSYGNLLFFAGWLGMLLLLLPRRNWHSGHFIVLIVGTVLYRFLLTASAMPSALLAALLTLPLAGATVVDLREGDEVDVETAGVGLIIVIWLLAALLFSFNAVRFILLLAAPLGIASGVAAGRLYDWLVDEARGWVGDGVLVRAAVAVAVLALVALPLRVARATAANYYLPSLDSAWSGVLTQLRETTPPDTVISAWWDYGYWIKYVAERRVNADGGSLRTTVPHWLARAQLAGSEAEAIGLLRMLDCASDARPYPEGAQGAMARLMTHGLDERGAYEAIGALAVLDRAAADAHLASLGLDPAARADVLAATHCMPPPAVLLLNTEQIAFGGWWRTGRWRPDRPYEGEPSGLFVRDWVDCTLADGQRRCPVDMPDGRGAQIEAVVFPDDNPREARIVIRRDNQSWSVVPSQLLLAGGMEVESLAGPDPSAPAVLLDGQQRALLGRPEAIASLYVRLMFLDGRGLDHFRKLDQRIGARGQRIAAWAVEW